MSLRDQLQDADTMTPEERAFAIASLLAASLLRARRSRFARPRRRSCAARCGSVGATDEAANGHAAAPAGMYDGSDRMRRRREAAVSPSSGSARWRGRRSSRCRHDSCPPGHLMRPTRRARPRDPQRSRPPKRPKSVPLGSFTHDRVSAFARTRSFLALPEARNRSACRTCLGNVTSVARPTRSRNLMTP